jgi:NAD(P)-dependent dehydrogenase (short-subunit alcohol dehydrogenase family)
MTEHKTGTHEEWRNSPAGAAVRGDVAMNLAGERVVVVGGTSGMGAATVRVARRLGAEVVSAGRRRVAELDSTDEASVRALFESVGELDHLLVTASPGQSGVFLEHDLAHARTLMDGKFFGSWTCARYAAPRAAISRLDHLRHGRAVVRPGGR